MKKKKLKSKLIFVGIILLSIFCLFTSCEYEESDDCPSCHALKRCRNCDGAKLVWIENEGGFPERIPCPPCKGTGMCMRCLGSGKK